MANKLIKVIAKKAVKYKGVSLRHDDKWTDRVLRVDLLMISIVFSIWENLY